MNGRHNLFGGLVVALGVLGAGCSADESAVVVDAMAAAARNTRPAGVVVAAPERLAADRLGGRCRPGPGGSWVFDPGRVSISVLREQLARGAERARQRASDAVLVSVELRCVADEATVHVDAAYYSPQQERLWWSASGTPMPTARVPTRLLPERIPAELQARIGTAVPRILITE